MALTDKDEVLVVSKVVFETTASSLENNSTLASRRSMMASITKSQADRSSRRSAKWMRDLNAALSCELIRPLS